MYVCALRCFSSFFVLILSFAIVGRVSAPAAAPVPAAACSRCDYSIASGSGSIIVVINGKTCCEIDHAAITLGFLLDYSIAQAPQLVRNLAP